MFPQDFSAPEGEKPKCHLSKFNTDLELLLSENCLSVQTRTENGFEWIWRSNNIYFTKKL